MTKTFNVDSSAYSQVVVTSVCKTVEVFEDDQAGSTDYYLSGSGDDSDRITKPAGTVLTFRSSMFFQPGQVIGWIKTAEGSVYFAQFEQC